MRSAVLILFAVCSAQAARLTAADSIAPAGATLVVPLGLVSNGMQISGVQFDVDADPVLAIGVAPGGALRDAGKNLYSGSIGARQLRYLIVGLNRNVLPDGVLLQVFITIRPAAPPGVYPIRISGALATDPDGRAMPLDEVTIRVNVDESPGGQLVQPAAVLNSASLCQDPFRPAS